MVNILGFSLLLPVLPYVVEDLGGSKIMYGALLSSYSIFQALGAPYLGRLSDSIGRKPVLLISQFGTLLAWVIFGVSYFIPKITILGVALPLLVIGASRILDGLTGGNNAVAQAYVTDITTQEEKKYIFGNIGGIVGIGMIVGPGLGGFLASGSLGYLGMVIGTGTLSLLTLISISLWLKESLPEEKRRKRSREPVWQSMRLIHRVQKLKPSPIIKNVFLLKGLFSMMMGGYISTIALFIIDLFGFNEQELGIFMLVVGVFITFNQAVLSKWFIFRIGEYKTLQLGLVFSIIGLISITLTDTLWVYIVLYYFLNLGISLCSPTINSLLAKNAAPTKAGEIMGISNSIASYSHAVVPIIAATLYSLFGSNLYIGMSILPLFGLIFSLKKSGHSEIEGPSC